MHSAEGGHSASYNSGWYPDGPCRQLHLHSSAGTLGFFTTLYQAMYSHLSSYSHMLTCIPSQAFAAWLLTQISITPGAPNTHVQVH